MNFIGEHLFPGQLGHFFLILAFVASLIALISYSAASFSKNILQSANWLKLARGAFMLQGLSIVVVFAVVFYICSHHLYEYMYAYKHASKELEPKYLLACIWEGQEGSFLLWGIWHSVIGSIFTWKKSDWEAPVMSCICLAQFFMFMMLLGIYAGNVKIGNSLFALTRNEISAPIFSRPDYLSLIKDGMGLNVLLRNYWMVIHPPVLFLGFALTIVPFGYAYGGLITKRFGDWVKPALVWTLAGACVLGTGIMMGGKWAYESLSFGGYWAWDPVENASLVPWMILIAALHTMLIYKHTGHSLRTTYLFVILAFVFVLYSSFLTKTGVLGEASVHSFTDPGRAINMMITGYMLIFALGGLGLFIARYKQIPQMVKEENFNSREFWMFIGSLVFFLSSIFIIAKTSLPLVNKIFKTSFAPPQDVEFSYNKVAAMIAIIIGLLTAFGQYLKYKDTPRAYLIKKIAIPTGIAAVLMLIISFAYPLQFHKQGAGFLAALYIASFASLYAMVANLFYLFTVQKAKLYSIGGSVSHAGFALMLFGMILSSSNKEVISSSMANGITMPSSVDPMTRQQDDPRENLTLLRNIPTRMGAYEVTYHGDSLGHEKGRRFFRMHFSKKDKAGQTKESFTLMPDVYQMKDNNMSSNPDTKSYLSKDVFTYLTFAINKNAVTDTASFDIREMKIGDTAFYRSGYAILNKVQKSPRNERYQFKENDLALVANMTIVGKDSSTYTAMPAILVDSIGMVNNFDDTLYTENLFVRFAGVADTARVKIGFKVSNQPIDFITVKAYVFPHINLVWLGLVIMGIGVCLSMLKRANWGKTASLIVLVLVSMGLFYMFLLAN